MQCISHAIKFLSLIVVQITPDTVIAKMNAIVTRDTLGPKLFSVLEIDLYFCRIDIVKGTRIKIKVGAYSARP
jgi:hypothetical protein